jgi:rSAM/selenodomain-associated transferase 1
MIFARRPVPGKVKTRLTPPLSPDEAAELYRCMLHDTLNRTRSLPGVDLLLFYTDEDGAAGYFREAAPGCLLVPQDEGDLGARMAAAFRHTFATGYERAAIIGSDSPELPLPLVTDALSRLASGADAVYVPSDDGGYCLLALRELHAELFEGIAWSTEKVLAESLARGAEAGLRVELLPAWYDVDTVADLQRSELLDETNGAALTRAFIRNLGLPRTS